eukprot:14007055-Alexandrium_andersonii.AAC.1
MFMLLAYVRAHMRTRAAHGRLCDFSMAIWAQSVQVVQVTLRLLGCCLPDCRGVPHASGLS